MRCPSCGYPLWNLTVRTCPECGAGFKPSEIAFAPSSVRFCCPHCDQQYFGTDADGHLVPRSFECVGCRAPIDMDEMVVRPIEGVAQSVVNPDDMPWLDRAQRGTVKAWFQTMGRAMVAPASLMRGVPADSPPGGAWLFMIVTVAVLFVVGMVPTVVLTVGLMGGVARIAGPGAGMPAGMATFQGMSFLVSFASTLVFAAVWMALTHMLLRIWGGATEGADRTWQALGYSSAAAAPMAFPCGCGYYPGIIWWVVAASIMLGIAHRGSGSRAVWAVVVSAVITAIMNMAVQIAFTFGTMGMLGGGLFGGGFGGGAGGGFGGAMPPPRMVYGGGMSGSLMQFAVQSGRWPRHGLELLGKPLQPADFSSNGVAIGASAPAFGTTTLSQLEASPADWNETAVHAAADLPRDVIAHRVGDFVFTFHGVPSRGNDRMLWLAVQVRARPPGTPSGGEQAIIVMSGGLTNTIAVEALPDAVKVQNDQRRKAGLPPLPKDLAAITVDRPARGSTP